MSSRTYPGISVETVSAKFNHVGIFEAAPPIMKPVKACGLLVRDV
jgi:hypothetical protein